MEVVKVIAEEICTSSYYGASPTDATSPLRIFEYFQRQALGLKSASGEVTAYQRVTALKTWSLLAVVAKKFTEVSATV